MIFLELINLVDFTSQEYIFRKKVSFAIIFQLFFLLLIIYKAISKTISDASWTLKNAINTKKMLTDFYL